MEEKKDNVIPQKPAKVDKETIAEVKEKANEDRNPAPTTDLSKVQPKEISKPTPIEEKYPYPKDLPEGIYSGTWEKINTTTICVTFRQKLPSGWLVLVIPLNRSTICMNFVEDKDHLWKIAG